MGSPLRHRGAALAALLLTAYLGAATEQDDALRRNATVKAVQKVKPSVVAVKRPATGAASRESNGTGLVVDERGYLITNRHVVAGAASVTVRLLDGAELSAEVVATDRDNDLAILRVKAKAPLVAQPLAPSADLEEGEDVIAVGHPHGYAYTVSKGVVSALDRTITMPTGERLTGLIQIDAAINPGNSGGPLLNILGQVIGINTALRQDAQGIAFAVRSEAVQRFLSKHLSAVKVAGVAHGLRCEERPVAGLGRRPRVVVDGVAAGAAETGVQSQDVIVAVGSVAVENRFDVERALWDRRPGESVAVRVLRGGRELTVKLRLQGAAPAEVAATRSGR
jgi:serine protease Do